MAKTGYFARGSAALVGAVTTTILGVKSNAAFGIDVRGFRISFDGVTASAVPIIVQLNHQTWATNAPGTASTTFTPVQVYGRTTASGCTAAANWTVEPTVNTVLEDFLLTPNGGTFVYNYPLGEGFDCAPGEGFSIRVTTAASIGVRCAMFWERA